MTSLFGKRRRLTALVVAVLLALCAVASACNVPVFRFALERWRPDAFRVTVFHRGTLTEAERESIRPLEAAQDGSGSNVMLQTVDVDSVPDGERVFAELRDQVWPRLKESPPPPLPWLVVQYPPHLRIETPVWVAPLARKSTAHLTDSPLRQEIVRRLVEGQTAVWLLLESGQPEQDDAAAQLLEAELKKLEQSLKLPELTAAPEDELLASAPLRIAFSVLRVPRSAIEEQALVGMLIRSEPDLAERSDAMVFPVFGRGRALLALIGAGITAQNIHDAAEFLVGPCSCQVKEQNPGFDLLLAADWDALLSTSGQRLTAVEMHSRQSSAEPDLVPIPVGSQPSASASREAQPAPATHDSSWLISGGLILGVAAFVILLAALNAGGRAT